MENNDDESKSIQDKLESINRNTKEILMWLRFANIDKLKEFLERELDTDAKKVVYEYSNGLRSTPVLEKLSSTPQRTVQSWWQRWYRQGIVIESERYKRRMSKIISLDDIGIKIPKLSNPPKEFEQNSEDIPNNDYSGPDENEVSR
jgi:hypothetical protein